MKILRMSLWVAIIFGMASLSRAQWVQTNNQNLFSLSVVATPTALPPAVLTGTDCGGGIYKTYDEGNSWVLDTVGLGGCYIRCFGYWANTLFAGTSNGVYYSDRLLNDNAVWLAFGTGIPQSTTVFYLMV